MIITTPYDYPVNRRGKRIPLCKNQINRLHWAARQRLKSALRSHLSIVSYAGASRNRIALPLPKAVIRITVYAPTRRYRDQDGFTPPLFIDAMKGILFMDDSSDKLRIEPTEIHTDKDNPRIEIDLEEMKENP